MRTEPAASPESRPDQESHFGIAALPSSPLQLDAPYHLYEDTPLLYRSGHREGFCRLRLFRPVETPISATTPAVALVTEQPTNEGLSIINGTEVIATEVCRRYSLNPHHPDRPLRRLLTRHWQHASVRVGRSALEWSGPYPTPTPASVHNIASRQWRLKLYWQNATLVAEDTIMSLLPPKAIDEFQALWKKHYGVELSREEATARAHQVFGLTRLLVKTDQPVKLQPEHKPADWPEQANGPIEAPVGAPPANPP